MKEVVDRIVQYPNRYKLTDAETGEELGTYDFTEVPGTVQQVGTEINAELFNSIEQDIEAAGNFDPNGTYPNLTAGDATHAASADAATKATQDGNGNNIASTYATKSEIKKLYTHILHVVFSGDSNEYIIRYDSSAKTSLTNLRSFYYSIYRAAISSDTGYPINIKIGNEYISGVVYALKIDNYDALSFYYNGKTKTHRTSDISIIRDAVIG